MDVEFVPRGTRWTDLARIHSLGAPRSRPFLETLFLGLNVHAVSPRTATQICTEQFASPWKFLIDLPEVRVTLDRAEGPRACADGGGGCGLTG